MHISRFFVDKKDEIIRLLYPLSHSTYFVTNEDGFDENLEIK